MTEAQPFPFGLLFHHFHGGCHPVGQGSISADTFERIVAHFGRDRLLDADVFYRRAVDGVLSPSDMCVTFDDGLRCQYDIALPVLRRLEISAFWFVYTSPLVGEGDYMEIYRYFRTTCFADVAAFYDAFDECIFALGLGVERDDALRSTEIGTYLPHAPFYSLADRRFRYVRDQVLGPARYRSVMNTMMMRAGFDANAARDKLWIGYAETKSLADAGHVVGLHSHTHPTDLAQLPPARQEQEYARNKAILEDVTGAPIGVMSHPCNSYGPETIAILTKLGLRVGFCAEMNAAGRSQFEMPRLNHAIVLKELGL